MYAIAPATVTVSDLTGLAASDLEFLRISEIINEYGKTDLVRVRDIRQLRDDRARLDAVGRYIASVIQSRAVKLEAQNNIAEIRLRQERQIGQLLADLPKRNGGRPADTGLDDQTPRLTDLGISKDQSWRWQLEAQLPDDQFEAVVADAKENGWELTSRLVQSRAAEYIREKTGQPVTRYLARSVDVTVKTVMPGMIVLYGVPVDRAWGVGEGDKVKVTVFVERIEDAGNTGHS